MQSWKKPTPEQVERAIALLGQIEQRRYFLDRLENPEWVLPLFERDFFAYPPQIIKDDIQGTLAFPPWPESRYLARMAGRAPAEVLQAILQVPETDNVIVHADFADAALAMPPALAAAWAEKEVGWLERQKVLYLMLLPLKLGTLISYLSKGAQTETALRLASVLLAIMPDPQAAEKAKKYGEEMLELSFSEPRPRFGIWAYGEILRKNFADLVAAAGETTLAILCNLLETAIRLSRSRKQDEDPNDYSYIWCPAIDRGQSMRDDLKSMLLSAVRDAAEQLARVAPEAVPGIIGEFEQRGKRWLIFHRLALHILHLLPGSTLGMIEERLADPQRYDDPHFRREYNLLLKDHYGRLGKENQEKILDWIKQAPPRKRAEEWFKFVGKEPSEDLISRFQNHWRLERLLPIESYLEDEWAKRYSALVKELGEPEDSKKEFLQHKSEFWTGPSSPKTAGDLTQMGPEELVAFLREWEPSGECNAATPEGLTRELTAIVAAEPERFAAEAQRLHGLDPTYVRGYIFGLVQALRQDRAFSSWDSVLSLCQWAVQQPREIPGRHEGNFDIDPHWGWTRAEIARLLSAGFENKTGELPYEYRKLAWTVLFPITQDPSPGVDEEEKHGGSTMDAATLSINTTRGEAMHAVVRYGLWVRRQIEKDANSKVRLANGLEEMPEVRDVLQFHVDVSKDSSLTIRAVYGQWFPWLVLLDQKWAEENVHRIFPPDEESRDFWNVAWGTYITSANAFDPVFEVLKHEYERAVERIGTPDEKRHLGHPDDHLAIHLTVYYELGKLELDEPDGLLERLYAKASDAILGSAIDTEGRRLQGEGRVPAAILGRLMRLWERRLDAAEKGGTPAEHVREVSSFGWWFASGKFDEKWAVARLEQGLRLVGKAEPEHMVVERLAALSTSMPAETLECLQLMVEGDKEGWAIEMWREHAKTILTNVMHSTDATVRHAGEELVHRLGAMGYFEFRDLLSLGKP